MRSSFVLALMAAVFAIPASAQFTLVAPNGHAAVEGNSNNAFPFNRASAGMRIQFLYDSTNFTAQGVTYPILISRLRYRADGVTGSWAGGSWPNVRIDLATAAVDFMSASATFASNLGPDAATVHNGTVTVQSGTSAAGVPGPWYIDIPITPFVYDPSTGGDLVTDIHLDGTGWSGTSFQMDHVSGAPAANSTRVYATAGVTATTGTVATQYGAVVEFSYQPASGLFAGFSATPRTGVSPLTVQFTDQSFSSAPGGVLAWLWDFDGDGLTDSTLQNPTHIFGCGDHAVSLTVIDGVHPNDVETRASFVVTDVMTVSFTATQVAPGVYQLTDTTTPTPTAWAWDFDGDGLTDSTLQNPIASLGTGCSASVRLTTTLACRTASATQALLNAPARADANLTGGSGTTSAVVGNLFDVTVTATEGVTVCGLTSLTYSGTGPYTASVYVTPDTYVGKETTASAWRLVAQGGSVMNAGGTTTPSVNLVPLDSPFYLAPGNYGVAVYHTAATGSAFISYTPLANGPFVNTDVTFHPSPTTAPGIAKTALFGGSTFQPRQWNGSFHYGKVSLNQEAGYGFFAPGCAGSLGVPGNTGTHPAVGNTMSVQLTNLPVNAAFFLLGFSRTTSTFGPLPFDLAPFGAPGCFARVSADANSLITGSGNTATFSLAIPNNPSFLGMQFYTQGLVIDPPVNTLGATTSDAAAAIIGS